MASPVDKINILLFIEIPNLYREHSREAEAKLQQGAHMTVMLTPIVSLIAGIIILIYPQILNYVIAIYLILIGILGLIG